MTIMRLPVISAQRHAALRLSDINTIGFINFCVVGYDSVMCGFVSMQATVTESGESVIRVCSADGGG